MKLAEARAAGEKRYFTGKPCKSGHVAERIVSSRACIVCIREKMSRARAEDTGRMKEIANASQRIRRAKDPQKHIDEVSAWQKVNPEKRAIARKRWKAKYPDKVRAGRSGRRAHVRNQMCSCCTPANFESVYKLARMTGGEVDHKVAIAFGGAHCCKNLEVLTKEAHLEKSKKDIATSARLRHAARRNESAA